jgi:hypothetical protein
MEGLSDVIGILARPTGIMTAPNTHNPPINVLNTQSGNCAAQMACATNWAPALHDVGQADLLFPV